MTKPFGRLLASILVGVGLLAGADRALAHDVWLTVTGVALERRVVVNYGHPGDRPPTLADKLLDLVAVAAEQPHSLLDGLETFVQDDHVVARTAPLLQPGALLVGARYDNGYWIKAADGRFRNATRRLAPGASESLWSGKFAKALSGAGAPWSRVLGHELEIVPLSDPTTARLGDILRVRVLFRGRPLAGAEVERGDGKAVMAEKDIPRFATDADGVATVPIVARGPQLLVIDHRLSPSVTPDQADADLFNATLWFETTGD